MKKIMSLILILFSLTACQKKEMYSVYVQPELIGTIYDKQTDKPISGVEIFRSSIHNAYTDDAGHFNMPAQKYEYYSYDNQLALLMSLGTISLRKPGYAYTLYSVSSMPRPQSRSG